MNVDGARHLAPSGVVRIGERGLDEHRIARKRMIRLEAINVELALALH